MCDESLNITMNRSACEVETIDWDDLDDVGEMSSSDIECWNEDTGTPLDPE